MRAKEHFLVLDLLRGVGSLIVLAAHWFDGQGIGWASSSASLAVDFFFALSGFVIAYAYDARLTDGTMTTATFLRQRFIRLYPMIAMGTLVGLARVLFHDGATHTLQSPGYYAFGVGMELLVIPDPFNRVGDQAVFLIDGPIWSLFFEIFANLLYVFFFRQIANRWVLIGVIAFGAVALVFSAYAKPEDLNFGWSSSTFVFGFSRILFSFFSGVALYRLRAAGRAPAYTAGPLALLSLFLVFLCQPRGSLSAPAEVAVIVFVFPVIMVLGANSHLGRLTRSTTYLANLSYPLYLLHEPLLWGLNGALKYFSLYERVSIYLSGFILAVIAVALSALCLHFYDEPIRKWLTKKMLPRRVIQTAHSV